jgi:Protein of unknown function (DUF2950)
MSTATSNQQPILAARWTLLALLVLTCTLAACSQSKQAPAAPAQRTFASPGEAAKALVETVQSGDRNSVLAMFGPGSESTIYSGDPTEDKLSFANFAKAYQLMNRWRTLDDKTEILFVGADNRAFPIPLTKNEAGQWYFNTAAGKDELLAQRIGGNELAAIDICAALADAQSAYFSKPREGMNGRQYAQKFISDEGKQDGLYWSSPEGQPKSPLGPLAAFATDEGYKIRQNSHQPFYGYYFRMLYKQGGQAKGGAKDYINHGKMIDGFAFVAYPADFGNSGVSTFVIDEDHVLYEKNLGPTTKDIATSMTEFNPDSSWTQVGG